MTNALAERQKHTAEVLERLRDGLSPSANKPQSVAYRYENRATVYVTGSYGRGEASQYSDLDLFIVSGEGPVAGDARARSRGDSSGARLLTNLDEICLKAELIELTRSHRLPDFSGDGRYLECYTGSQLANEIGSDKDDYANTFTARLLLLLESRALIGKSLYDSAVDSVVAAYFRDYADHSTNFEPTFLLNDILRLWRTFCVNYENRTSDGSDAAKAKRKLKHFKLSHSRLLTCYSGIVTLLDVFARNHTVGPDDIREMVAKTPMERIADVGRARAGSLDPVSKVTNAYERFLVTTAEDEEKLCERFGEKKYARERMAEARAFAKLVHDLVMSIDAGRLSQAVVI